MDVCLNFGMPKMINILLGIYGKLVLVSQNLKTGTFMTYSFRIYCNVSDFWDT